MKKNIKDIIIRAVKTFIQGFLGALVVTLPNADITSIEVIKSLLIGALAAGISAVMNIVVKAFERTGEILEILEENEND